MSCLGDFKLGDTVHIFVDCDNDISWDPTRKTIPAVIFGISDSGTYYLGWKKDEAYPNGVEHRNGHASPGVKYISGQSEYRYRYTVVKEDLSLFIVNNAPARGSSKLELDMDPSTSWRSWVHSIPGECPCGTSRAVCIYHKDA